MVTIRSDDFTRRNKIVLKTADETVNNNNSTQADDHLLVALGANETWILRFFVKYNSNTTANFKYALVVPSGATYSALFQGDNTGGFVEYYRESSDQLVDGKAANWAFLLEVVVKTSSTAGNVVLHWAQGTANASDTKVLIGSNIVAHRLA